MIFNFFLALIAFGFGFLAGVLYIHKLLDDAHDALDRAKRLNERSHLNLDRANDLINKVERNG